MHSIDSWHQPIDQPKPEYGRLPNESNDASRWYVDSDLNVYR